MSSPMRVRREPTRAVRARGFTLLEVLIGLLVLALALLALMRTAAVEVAAFGELRQHTLAGWLAEELLVETRLASPFPPTGSSSGTRRFGNADWRYDVRVQGTDVPTVHRIDVRVFTDADRDRAIAQLTGFAGADLQ